MWRSARARGTSRPVNPSQTLHSVYLPYWFLAALAAAAPLVTRFSVRALLIAMTVAALLLGTVTFAINS